jgi:hypothetical protein
MGRALIGDPVMAGRLGTIFSRNLVVRPSAVNALTIRLGHDHVRLQDVI